ncbi:MAG: hypothetical protein HY268_32850 [Deltaproteobacteria bacterium]|nr:hypothetical protein [Deltaproteobacteria bacterium]
MPIQKFRDLDAARRALWQRPGSADLVAHIKALWAFSTRLVPRQIPRGVRKFQSIEGANQDREQWVRHRVQTLRRDRGKPARQK